MTDEHERKIDKLLKEVQDLDPTEDGQFAILSHMESSTNKNITAAEAFEEVKKIKNAGLTPGQIKLVEFMESQQRMLQLGIDSMKKNHNIYGMRDGFGAIQEVMNKTTTLLIRVGRVGECGAGPDIKLTTVAEATKKLEKVKFSQL